MIQEKQSGDINFVSEKTLLQENNQIPPSQRNRDANPVNQITLTTTSLTPPPSPLRHQTIPGHQSPTPNRSGKLELVGLPLIELRKDNVLFSKTDAHDHDARNVNVAPVFKPLSDIQSLSILSSGPFYITWNGIRDIQ